MPRLEISFITKRQADTALSLTRWRYPSSVTVDDGRSSIVISISIVIAIFIYDNRLVSISIVVAIFIYNYRFMVPIPVTVISPDCYATRANTDPDLLCGGRYCTANTCYSNYHY
jgi:hypothetical protein